jgi:hypothetical protein
MHQAYRRRKKRAASGSWRPKSREERPMLGIRYITSDGEKCRVEIAAGGAGAAWGDGV